MEYNKGANREEQTSQWDVGGFSSSQAFAAAGQCCKVIKMMP
jgi:hypothetical protein